MSDYPRITIITPSFNQAQFLDQTIFSVLGQRYPNLEYMIFDGGSTDGSEDVIKRHAASLTYWVSEKDRGQAHAINKGFERATGEVVGWLNSDDLLVPDALAAVADRYRDGQPDFLYGDGWLFWNESPRPKRRVQPGPEAARDIRIVDRFQQPSTFWSRRVLDGVGLLNEDLHYAFDWEYFIRIADAFPMTYLPRILSSYRIHGQHKSGTGGRKRAAEIVEVMRRHAPPDYAGLYSRVLPEYDALARCKRRWRRFYFLPFVMAHPRLAAGVDRRALKLVTTVL